MKGLGGGSVAGLLLLLCICRRSNTQTLRLLSNEQEVYRYEALDVSGVGDLKDNIANPRQLTDLPATSGGNSGRGPRTWSKRSTVSDGDFARQLIIGLSGGDKSAADQTWQAADRARPAADQTWWAADRARSAADRARPAADRLRPAAADRARPAAGGIRPAAGRANSANASSETVLGFETITVQVAGRGAPPSVVRRPDGPNVPSGGQQMDQGNGAPPQRGLMAPPVFQFVRENISMEVDADPGVARGSGHPSAPAQRGSKARMSQGRNGAMAGEPDALLKWQGFMAPGPLNRSVATRHGARIGGINGRRDSASASAEINEDQSTETDPAWSHTGAGATGPGQVPAASAPVPSVSSGQQRQAAPAEWRADAIPGRRHLDYPVLSRLPQSGFDCCTQKADGFYADTSEEARCQAFWVCHNDQKDGFLCPNGTIFNQHYLVCDWWFNVRCQDSPKFYGLNRNIGLLGTRTGSGPTSAQSPSAADARPVLTLLHDMLQYPRVPSILPNSWPKLLDRSPLIHSATRPALPSREQYSDDSLHVLDGSSVHVSGGVPGSPPTQKHGVDQLPRPTSQEVVRTAIQVSGQRKRLTKRQVKRRAKQHTPRVDSKGYLKGHKESHQLHERKVREHILMEESEGTESAALGLPDKMSQVEQSGIPQIRKRAPEPSSGGAYTPVQEGAVRDRRMPAGPGLSEPLLQTVDRVAFPMDVRGPDFPKVEEDFNIRETSGARKSTSIKDVLPSHIIAPQSNAVKVMAASGSQQNDIPSSALQNPEVNQPSIIDLSGRQNTGVPENYAGISLTEDVRLDKNAHDQMPGAMSDSESVSGSYGPGHGVSLTEDVEFDKKSGVPAAGPPAAPLTNPEPRSTAVLDSATGDNDQGPGAAVRENVQIDQKRDAPPAQSYLPYSTMSRSSKPSGSFGINNNGQDVSMSEGMQIDRRDSDHPDVSSQGLQPAQQSPSSPAGGLATIQGQPSNQGQPSAAIQNSVPGAESAVQGGRGAGPGEALAENVQIGHTGGGPPDVPNQGSQGTGGQTSPGEQAMAGGDGGGWGPAGGPETENGGHPEGQMNVEAFLADRRAVESPAPTPPPTSAIRSEDSVQVNFDETPQGQYHEEAASNTQAQTLSLPSQTPLEAGTNGEPSASTPFHDNAGDSGVKISPKSEQVLEEQSNVKILIPYDKEGGGYVPSGQTTFSDPMGNFGLSSQVNSGLALDSAGPHSIVQDQQQDQSQVQLGQPQNKLVGQAHGQMQSQLQGQPPGQSPSQPQGENPKDNTGSLLRSNPPPAPGVPGTNSGPSAQPSAGRSDVMRAEDVPVHLEPSAAAGPPSGSPVARPGYQHAGDSRMNASAMTLPKTEGSSKILEQLDARSQFASNIGDAPGTVKTHVQMQDEKLGDTPGTSDLFDDPSALKREMPSENVKLSEKQQGTPMSEPQGEVIPGQQNVQITSESVSRIIKNPSRHRSAVSDPSGLDLPELLRPPGFGTKYYPYKAYPTLRTVKPAGPATPQPSVARLAGSIDMKSMNKAGGDYPNKQASSGVSAGQPALNSASPDRMSQPLALQRTQRGDLSTKLSETLKMVDNILGPPPFKSKRNPQPELQRTAYLDTMTSGHPSSLKGSGLKRASGAGLEDGNTAINLTVLISDPLDGQTPSQMDGQTPSTSPNPSARHRPLAPPGPSALKGRHAVQEREKIRIFNSLKNMAQHKPKGESHRKHKLKQTAKETGIKDIIEVKTSADSDEDSDKTYDYDISQLPAWMKRAVKSRVKSPRQR